MSPTRESQVAIIGAGPAGSSAAIALARAGCSVVVCEKDDFPRFHVGESLLPMSNPLFDALGIYERIAAAGFQEKWGATLIDETGEREVCFDFAERIAPGQRPTYQVPRDRFDALLLDCALDAGAELRKAAVRCVDFADGRAELVFADGTKHRCEYVIDGSGRAGVIANRLGLREKDPALQKAAIYSYYSGVDRLAGRRAGDVRIVSFGDLGWAWLIPLHDSTTSVGFVLELADWEALKGGGVEATLDRLVQRSPAVRSAMRDAVRVQDVRVESSFSYRVPHYSGERWLLAGDAGSFIDPVFSTGVLLALQSGVEAAAAVETALRVPARRAGALREFSSVQRKRYTRIRRIVLGFYDRGIRDLLFEPTRRFGLDRAVLAMLAGEWSPRTLDRLRLGVFFALGRVQRVVPLVKRRHSVQSSLAGSSP